MGFLDKDSDGVTDWEVAKPWADDFAEQNRQALGDTDGDGVSDLQEAMSGTDPNVPNNHALSPTPAAVAPVPEVVVPPSVVPQPVQAEEVALPANSPGLGAVDDAMFVTPVAGSATGGGATGSLNGQPTPPDPDDVVVAAPAVVPTPAPPPTPTGFDEPSFEPAAMPTGVPTGSSTGAAGMNTIEPFIPLFVDDLTDALDPALVATMDEMVLDSSDFEIPLLDEI